MKTIACSLALMAGVGISTITVPAEAAGPTESVLFSFLTTQSGNRYGSDPEAGLTIDKSGALYGTTQVGGAGGYGVVFRLEPPATRNGTWTPTVLHSFTAAVDGGNPFSPVIFDASGALYGATAAGGSGNNGVVFKLTPSKSATAPWPETVLYAFTGNEDGGYPFGNLAFSASGSLYGSTFYSGCGTVFELTPPPSGKGAWTFKDIYSFAGSNGCNHPFSGVILDKHGAIYGTTYDGGPNNAGTVFRLTESKTSGVWEEETLYSFLGLNDGTLPAGSLAIDTSGAVYGTTTVGGSFGFGVVYKLIPSHSVPWKSQILHRFTGGNDGAYPIGGVTIDRAGNVYGTTLGGGSVNQSACLSTADPLAGTFNRTTAVNVGWYLGLAR